MKKIAVVLVGFLLAGPVVAEPDLGVDKSLPGASDHSRDHDYPSLGVDKSLPGAPDLARDRGGPSLGVDVRLATPALANGVTSKCRPAALHAAATDLALVGVTWECVTTRGPVCLAVPTAAESAFKDTRAAIRECFPRGIARPSK